MEKTSNCVLLIDDDEATNFYHKRMVLRSEITKNIQIKENACEALNFLISLISKGDDLPEFIFLDINMPGMNGWEFLDEVMKFDQEYLSNIKIVMLSASENPTDMEKINNYSIVWEYMPKPLSIKKIHGFVKQFDFVE